MGKVDLAEMSHAQRLPPGVTCRADRMVNADASANSSRTSSIRSDTKQVAKDHFKSNPTAKTTAVGGRESPQPTKPDRSFPTRTSDGPQCAPWKKRGVCAKFEETDDGRGAGQYCGFDHPPENAAAPAASSAGPVGSRCAANRTSRESAPAASRAPATVRAPTQPSNRRPQASRSPSPGRIQALSKKMDEEMAERYKVNPNSPPSTPSPRTFHNATDMEHYAPYPDDDIFELSPSGGGMVMNEWDRMYCTPPDEIVPGFMWLAQERGVIMGHECTTDHFTHVLFATNKEKSPYPARNYHVINLPDDPDTDLRARFEDSNAWIDEAYKNTNTKLLIHCRMGQSRSTTMVVAWLMHHFRCTLKEALLWTKARRDIICPNTGFFVQMQAYEKELLGLERPSID